MKTPGQFHVLYADDNEDACLMMSVLLELVNIEVVAAGTVAEAWRLSQTEHFDLYLLDVRFPDGDGLELCRRLHEDAPRTPIIFYSGDAYETDRQKGLAAGAVGYLTKPHINDLAEMILMAIRLSKRPATKNFGNSLSESQTRIG